MSGATVWALVAGAIVLWYLFAIWNGLIRARNNVDKAFADIDVCLQQRHDELGKLVDACRGFMEHEKKLLEEVTRLRSDYARADGVAAKLRLSRDIEAAAQRLHVAVEQYPTLRSSENVLELQRRISATETTLADRRELFNDSITIYNTQIERMPDALLARFGSFSRRPLLTIAAEKKEDVKIALSG